MDTIFIGTAGWNIPSQLKLGFSGSGTHLERYARKLNCVEINSSFYREHKYETYQKWATMVPADFRFSVKLSKYFTHTHSLQETGAHLKDVIQSISGLKEKWGLLLVQLPPGLEFSFFIVDRFLSNLRKNYLGPVIWEPRHQSWAEEEAVSLLEQYNINKVIADPEPCPLSDDQRTRMENIRYLRLHGSPEIYKSRYSIATIMKIATSLTETPGIHQQTWCVFDNTTYGFATENALELKWTLTLKKQPMFHEFEMGNPLL